jgi:hypothetical protein
MRPRRVVINLRSAGRTLAWTGLVATAALLGFLLQTLAASALVAPRSAELPAACQSNAGATLADGDDARVRFLANLCGTAVVPHPSR